MIPLHYNVDAEKLFKKFDQDGDGQLDEAEMTKFLGMQKVGRHDV